MNKKIIIIFTILMSLMLISVSAIELIPSLFGGDADREYIVYPLYDANPNFYSPEELSRVSRLSREAEVGGAICDQEPWQTYEFTAGSTQKCLINTEYTGMIMMLYKLDPWGLIGIAEAEQGDTACLSVTPGVDYVYTLYRCEGAGPASCRDSDGGKVYREYGVVSVTDSEGEIIRSYDDCYSDGYTLMERFCDTDLTVSTVTRNCVDLYGSDYICDDGECLKEEDEDDPTPDLNIIYPTEIITDTSKVYLQDEVVNVKIKVATNSISDIQAYAEVGVYCGDLADHINLHSYVESSNLARTFTIIDTLEPCVSSESSFVQRKSVTMSKSDGVVEITGFNINVPNYLTFGGSTGDIGNFPNLVNDICYITVDTFDECWDDTSAEYSTDETFKVIPFQASTGQVIDPSDIVCCNTNVPKEEALEILVETADTLKFVAASADKIEALLQIIDVVKAWGQDLLGFQVGVSRTSDTTSDDPVYYKTTRETCLDSDWEISSKTLSECTETMDTFVQEWRDVAADVLDNQQVECTTNADCSDNDQLTKCDTTTNECATPFTCFGSLGTCLEDRMCSDGITVSNRCEVVGEYKCLSRETSKCPVVEAKGTQLGILASDVSRMTASDLLTSICDTTVQCEENSTCRPLSWFVDEGFLTDKDADNLIDKSSVIMTSTGTLLGGVAGIALCETVAVSATVLSGGAGAVLIPLCFAGGAVAGGTITYGINELIEEISDKNKEDVGYCVLESESKMSEYINSLAKFVQNIFGIENNDTAKMLSIGILGAFLFIIIGLLTSPPRRR